MIATLYSTQLARSTVVVAKILMNSIVELAVFCMGVIITKFTCLDVASIDTN